MKIAFLDRDGVINENIEGGYVTRWEEFEFLPGVKKAIRRLRESGYRIYIVSNQAGVNRGHMRMEDLLSITEKMLDEIRAAGGDIDDVAYCPHRPDEGCGCRKPEPGMITMLAEKHGLDLRDGRAFFVGDAPTDIEAGRRAGLRGIFISDRTTRPVEGSEVVVGSLAEAVEWMIDHGGERVG
ncbi:MAG: HAD family hydrolase [Candidatus Latescibacteria bacterium]|nr:HAD family hydrolase [Candidatus Latescibacterota bacterium]